MSTASTSGNGSGTSNSVATATTCTNPHEPGTREAVGGRQACPVSLFQALFPTNNLHEIHQTGAGRPHSLGSKANSPRASTPVAPRCPLVLAFASTEGWNQTRFCDFSSGPPIVVPPEALMAPRCPQLRGQHAGVHSKGNRRVLVSPRSFSSRNWDGAAHGSASCHLGSHPASAWPNHRSTRSTTIRNNPRNSRAETSDVKVHCAVRIVQATPEV